jgi:hypothetical protein
VHIAGVQLCVTFMAIYPEARFLNLAHEKLNIPVGDTNPP